MPNRPLLLEPVELLRREAQALEEVERLLEPGRNEKPTPGRQLAHEEFEDRRLGFPMLQVGLDHVELVEVGEQWACGKIHGPPAAQSAL